jgi:hypothetical protein
VQRTKARLNPRPRPGRVFLTIPGFDPQEHVGSGDLFAGALGFSPLFRGTGMDFSQLGALPSRLGSLLRRPLYLISVRARIAALAFIPVIGFAIVGLAYLAGEQEVEAAFASVKVSGALADSSRDFKGAISAMRISAKEFVSWPSEDTLKTFHESYALAQTSLEAIVRGDTEHQHIGSLQDRLKEMKDKFAALVEEQEQLGFTKSDGIQQRMVSAAAAVERIINEDMSWLADADQKKLLFSLLIMRRHEADYRLNQRQYSRDLFFNEIKNFNRSKPMPKPSAHGSKPSTNSTRRSPSSRWTAAACCPKPTISSPRRARSTITRAQSLPHRKTGPVGSSSRSGSRSSSSGLGSAG